MSERHEGRLSILCLDAGSVLLQGGSLQFSDATYLAWLTGFIVLSGLALFMQGKQKRLAVDLLLVFATLFVAGSLYTAFEGRKGGNAAYLEADKAELSLRMNSAFISIKRRMPADSALDRQFKHFSKDTYEQAEKCLSKAIAASPDSAVLHAKEIILLAEEGKGIKKPIEQLKSLGGSEENQAKGKALADLIGKIYIDQKISADQLPAMRKILEKNVPPGWYRDIL